MEILYVWIEEHSIFVNQGFNFGGKYIFKFNYESKQLTIEDNPDYIEKFFGDKILNITALVGENGAGKTSLLEFILEETRIYEKTDKKFFIIFKSRQDEELSIFGTSEYVGLVSLVGNDKHKGFKEISKKNGWRNIGISPNSEVRINPWIKDTSFIYFSNVFEGNREFQKLGIIRNGITYHDITTNYLVVGEENVRRRRIDMDKKYRDIGEIDLYHDEEIERQIIFATSDKAKEIKEKVISFALPEKLIIKILDFDLEFLKTTYAVNIEVYKFYERVNTELDTDYRKQSQTLSRVKSKIVKAAIYKALLDIGQYGDVREIIYTENFSIPKDVSNPIETVKGLFKNVLERIETCIKDLQSLQNEESKKEHLWIFLKNRFSAYIELIDLFDNKSMKNIFKIPSIGAEKFVFEVVVSENRPDSSFGRLWDKLGDTGMRQTCFSFSWEGLSSGQKAMLKMYSRFYSVYSVDSAKLCDNIIILIDEGELYFHPAWQKKFIQDITNVLPNIFAGKDIQILLTSNSPFVVSDLPKSNCVFLRLGKGENGKTPYSEVDDMKELEQTFGAHIYQLFRSTFFLQDKGIMGEFSKHKINELIGEIQDYKPNEKKQKLKLRHIINEKAKRGKQKYSLYKKARQSKEEKIARKINIIGEPVIKQKLVQMWEEKIKRVKELEELKILKKKIEERIKKLEGGD